MYEPRILRAVIGDLDAVTECSRAAYGKYVVRLGYAPKPMVADYAEWIVQGRVSILVGGAETLGVLVLLPDRADLLVYSVAVDPGHQGHGLGRRLMAFAEDEARRAGHARVVLYTNERMEENVRFYESLGYVCYDRRPHPSRAGAWLIHLSKAV